MTIVARIHTPFYDKFGIPRQSGLVPSVWGEIFFEPPFHCAEAVRGIEEFSHIWLLWGFSGTQKKNTSLTVYPPRLGGKEKRGVFATRSPFRPNGIGLSCVKLEGVRQDEKGHPVLVVSGADLLDGTPIYDIKPYLPYTDAHPEAEGGFGQLHSSDGIRVEFPQAQLEKLPESVRETVRELLEQDPRAAYNKKPDSVYGLRFGAYDIRFTAKEGVLTVTEVVNVDEGWERIK